MSYRYDRNRAKKNIQVSNFGFSTILLGFTMICIITFSALALVTANSDYRLSKRVADKNKTYYDVQQEAFERLADIDHILSISYNSSNSIDSYYSMVKNQLSEQDGQYYEKDDNCYFCFTNKLSDSQTLTVAICIQYPTTSTTSYFKIVQWQTITDTEVETDNTLNLIN